MTSSPTIILSTSSTQFVVATTIQEAPETTSNTVPSPSPAGIYSI